MAMTMSRISINGQVYKSNAGNITMTNNKILIDGKDVTPSEKQIYIIVNGDINKLECDVTEEINVIGNVKSVNTSSGDVTIGGGVQNSVLTNSGDVSVKGNTGGVKTMSGDVKAKNINGSISSISGDIIQKS